MGDCPVVHALPISAAKRLAMVGTSTAAWTAAMRVSMASTTLPLPGISFSASARSATRIAAISPKSP